MKIKAVIQNNVVSVKILIPHPMETGRRKDEKGALVPAHYVTELTAQCKGKTIFHAELGPGISKDPFVSFQFEGAGLGDIVTVSWVDSKGATEKAETAIAAI